MGSNANPQCKILFISRQKRTKINFSDVITQDHLLCLSKKDLSIKLKHYNIDDAVENDEMDEDESEPEPSKYDGQCYYTNHSY